MLSRLEDARLVAVVGASGSGKSSLVRAGLLPVIREGFLLGTPDWQIVAAKPGDDPFGKLASELARGAPSAAPAAELQKLLQRPDRGLLRRARGRRNRPGDTGAGGDGPVRRALRVPAVRPPPQDAAARDQAAAFVALLLRTAAEPDGRVRLVLTCARISSAIAKPSYGLPEAVMAANSWCRG